jgi:hypothetical protein
MRSEYAEMTCVESTDDVVKLLGTGFTLIGTSMVEGRQLHAVLKCDTFVTRL